MFYRFLLCSGFAASINLLTGYLMYAWLGFDDGGFYAISVATAFIAGMGVSYSLNRTFTYDPSGRAPEQELRDFLGVSLGGLLLTTLTAQSLRMALPLAVAGLPSETLAHILAVGLTAFYSFFAHKHISFRRATGPLARGRTRSQGDRA